MSLEEFDFSQVEQMMNQIFKGSKMSFLELVEQLIDGETELSLKAIFKYAIEQVVYEIGESRSGLIHILLLVIIAAVFSNFAEVFKSTQVSEISFSMLYLLLITICIHNFRILVSGVSGNVEGLTSFMEVLGPLYFLAVAAATGSVTSVSFHQLVLLIIYLVEVLILKFLIPLTQIYMIIRILSEFSPEIQLTKFSELIETLVSWMLKTLFGAVMGINLIHRILSPAIDTVKRSVLLRGGESIPLVGDLASGAAEVVLSTAVLIKNGIGVAGMLVCFVICLTPMIQMMIITFMYQLVAAVMQPISDRRMVNCISGMAEGNKMLLKIVFTTGVLFLVTIAVTATTTGG